MGISIFTHSEWFKVFQFNTNNSIQHFFVVMQHIVEWIQILVFIITNSIRQSFVQKQLNDQTVLFLTIPFSRTQQS